MLLCTLDVRLSSKTIQGPASSVNTLCLSSVKENTFKPQENTVQTPKKYCSKRRKILFKAEANSTQFPGSRFRHHMRRWWRAYVVRARWLWRQFDTISGHGLNHTPALNDLHRTALDSNLRNRFQKFDSSNVIGLKRHSHRIPNGVRQHCELTHLSENQLPLSAGSVATATTKTRNYLISAFQTLKTTEK